MVKKQTKWSRRNARTKQEAVLRRRRLLFEPMESRRLLAVDVVNTFEVTNTNDAGLGSLRDAIVAANASQGADRIAFDIQGNAPHSIALQSVLPALIETVVIDGTSNPSFVDQPVIVLDGSSMISPNDGLKLVSGTVDSTIRGLVLHGFSTAVRIENTTGVTVAGNYLGTNAVGTAAVGNSGAGVLLFETQGVTVGGNAVADQNLISGNERGVQLIDSHDNVISGNLIGTNATGDAEIANQLGGILVESGSTNNLVGGSIGGARNVIAGNAGHGIEIASGSANEVVGNYVGLDVTGTAVVSNSADAISISGGIDHRIEGNTVIGNVEVSGASTPASGVTFVGNTVGLNANGNADFTESTTIGFGGSANAGSVYNESGFTLRATGFNFTGTQTFTGPFSLGMAGTSSTPGGIRVTPDDGQPFDAYSLQVSEANSAIGPQTLQFIGLLAEGGTVTQSYTTSTAFVRETVDLIGFENLIELRYTHYFTTFDNLVLATTPAYTDDVILGGEGEHIFGGSSASESNVVTGDLLVISDANVLLGNYVGFDASGDTAFLESALRIEAGASNNQVGGPSSQEGNFLTRVHVTGGGTNANQFEGNAIGLRVDLSDGLGISATPLILVDGGASGNVIGTAQAGNLIGSSVGGFTVPNQTGVRISGSGTDQNIVQNNSIGYQGVVSEIGLRVDTGAGGTVIGGSAAGVGNNIQGNAGKGVDVNGVGDVTIQGNVIVDNGSGVYSLDAVSMIFDNRVSGNASHGIFVAGTGNALIQGNRIGLDSSGLDSQPNDGHGIAIVDADGSQIGGADPSQRNVISGNLLSGISMVDTSDNLIAGNYIGTDSQGIQFVGNGNSGIELLNTTSERNQIGGNQSQRNIIGGNSDGIRIINAGSNNWIAANQIGFGNDPAIDVSNIVGVWIDSTSNTIIGTDGDGTDDLVEGNLISGNSDTGIVLTGSSSGNRVSGNLIGADSSGQQQLGYQGTGIRLTGEAQANLIGTDGDGVSDTAERNVISGWHIEGVGAEVELSGANVSGNVVAGNYLGLAADGTTVLTDALYGVVLSDGAHDNTIGTNSDGQGDQAETNVIGGFNEAGVVFFEATLNTVAGNLIGTDVSGTNAASNGYGVSLRAGSLSNLIGTNGDGVRDGLERNVVSGNFLAGIAITGSSDLNHVAGNLIGTDETGRVALPNDGNGIEINSGSSENVIGAPLDSPNATAFRNLVSGNLSDGIYIGGAETQENLVRGNWIGTEVSGTLPLGNLGAGVRIADDAGENVIGGESGGNVIAANTDGVLVGTLADGTSVSIQSNWIGTNQAGLTGLGNAGVGINAGDDMVLGGVEPGQGNVLAYNQIGVQISDPSAISVLRGNSIYSNLGLGIDVGQGGEAAVTPNDPTEEDGIQNFPVLSTVVAGNTTTISGALQSSVGDFELDFYASAEADSSGYGEGKRYLGSTTISTDTSGFKSFLVEDLGFTIDGEFVSVTATAATGSTSEFSLTVEALLDGVAVLDESTLLTTLVDPGSEEAVYGEQVNSVDEGQEIFLTGSFTSLVGGVPTVSISWGDSIVEGNAELEVDTAGFSGSHVFVDDDPTQSEFDLYEIVVTATDDVSAGSASVFMTVNNVAPALSLLELTDDSIGEGQETALRVEFSDPGINDQHVAIIDWGDGSQSEIVSIPEGDRVFEVPHRYADDGDFEIQITLSDDDGGTSEDQVLAEVLNIAPTATIVLPENVVEGDEARLNLTAFDPGGDALTFLWEVSQDETSLFTGTDSYLDFVPVDDGDYEVILTVTDDGNASTTVLATLYVANAAPIIFAEDVSFSSAGIAVSEGVRLSFAGTFFDAGLSDQHQITFDFGDETVTTIEIEQAARSFGNVQHVYLDDPDGQDDNYVVTISVFDGIDLSSVEIAVAVPNFVPEIGIRHDGDDGTNVTLRADLLDLGILDSQSYEWVLDGVLFSSGTVLGGQEIPSITVPKPTENLNVSLRTVDDDGGEGTSTVEYFVLDGNDNEVQITETPSGIVLSQTTGGVSRSTTVAGQFDRILLATGGGADSVNVQSNTNVETDLGEGNDSFSSGSGDDVVITGGGHDSINTGDGSDSIVSVSGDDTIDSGTGNDVLFFRSFSDKVIKDGGGTDTLNFSGVSQGSGTVDGITLDLRIDNGVPQTVHSTGSIALEGTFENVIGSNFKDFLVSSDASNQLFGGGGDDRIVTSGGFDTVLGGEGSDSIFGGPGGNDSIDGGTGNDLITSGDGDNDSVIGGDGNDTITSGGGIGDSLFGGSGNDSIVSGGAGRESLDGGSGDDSLVGGDGNDSLFGGPGNDSIVAGGSGDTVSGGDGDDRIVGHGEGNESLDGGSGNDTIIGSTAVDGAADSIFGGYGDDYISVGMAGDSVDGGDGNDLIFGGLGDESIVGGLGDDTISAGAAGKDTIFGGPGNDVIQSVGGSGAGTVDGGEGDDSITLGSGGEQSVRGGNGDDTIASGGTGDSIFGGPGNDSIVSSGGNEVVDGGDGDDAIVGGSKGSTSLQGGGGDDTITSTAGDADSIFGGPGNDSIVSGGMGDTVHAGDGDDSIVGGDGGNEVIDGGAGNDSIFGGPGQNDSLSGGSGDDTIVGGGKPVADGSGGGDSILGGEGNDSIFGGPAGNDSIDGGAGDDTIKAVGGGRDSVFGGPGNDLIEGSSTESDTLRGGVGHDTIFGTGTRDLVDGGEGDDLIVTAGTSTLTIPRGTIFGGPGNDSIQAGEGVDVIEAGDGDDSVFGGSSGSESIDGGDGNDTILSGPGDQDSIFGGAGDDSITGQGKNDTLDGGGGDDSIFGGNGGNASIGGGLGDDTIISEGSRDTVFGGAGDDSLRATLGGEVSLLGGSGDDSVFGGPGNDDSISGGDGDDTLGGGGGLRDTVFGGSGNDLIIVSDEAWDLKVYGDSAVTGTTAMDMVVFESDADVITAATGASSNLATISKNGVVVATLTDVAEVALIGGDSPNRLDATGFQGNSGLVGNGGNDTLLGGSGNDTLEGGQGDDSLVGGVGDDTYLYAGTVNDSLGLDEIEEVADESADTLDFYGLDTGVTVDLRLTTRQTVTENLDLQFSSDTSLENVIGTTYSDVLIGNSRDSRLVGGAGADTLVGGGGNDDLLAARTKFVYLDFDSQTDPGDHVYTADEIAGIQQRMREDFSQFDVEVSLEKPADEAFITIYFNSPPTVNGISFSGGVADRIGWRDVTRGGSVQVDVNGFLGDQPNQLPGTPDNFIALSSTIAAHELGHTYGLRHHDAFGNPGDGVFSGLGAAAFTPSYEGFLPATADETANHLLASPASVKTTINDALQNPYFGPREALKLAFFETGFTVKERSDAEKAGTLVVNGVDHAVQALGDLQPLVVPNTNTNLNRAHYAASAVNVTGSIDEVNGKSENDLYSFTALKDDVITFEVYSVSLRTRIPNQIDSLLRVYDSLGNKVDYYGSPFGAFNDDGFEPTDSILIDVQFPETGTYYVEVDTFNFGIEEFPAYVPDFDAAAFCDNVTGGDIRCDDTDTGDYELLIYRFDSQISSESSTDVIIPGEGADTIRRSSGKTLVVASDGTDDTFQGPAGLFEEILNNVPVLSVVSAVTVDEGETLNLVATATDDPLDAVTYSLEAVDGTPHEIVGLSIDPQNGSIVWLASDDADVDVKVVATDLSGARATSLLSIEVKNVGPTFDLGNDEILGDDSSSVAGLATLKRGPVSFQDPGDDQFTAVVNYGDGSGESTLAIDAIERSFGLEHDYNRDGDYTVSVKVMDDDGGSMTDTFVVTIEGLNTPPVAKAGGPYTVGEGGTVELDASLSTDDQQDTEDLTFQWDLDGDNIFGETGLDALRGDEVGIKPFFNAVGLDGPLQTPWKVALRVTDGSNASNEANAEIGVENLAPVISEIKIADSNPLVEGTKIEVTGVASDVAADQQALVFSWRVTKTADPTVAAVDFATGTGATWDFTPDDNAVYKIFLTVTDDDGGSATGDRSVTVDNANPVADDLIVSLVENPTSGAAVGAIAVSDPGNDAIQFSIVDLTEEGPFAIDPESGVITVSNPELVDFEQIQTFSLVVRATDKDGASDDSEVTVNVVNLPSLDGIVFVDIDEDGEMQANEPGIDFVTIELQDSTGQPVLDAHGDAITSLTSDGGLYLFEDLHPGEYRFVQQQPTGITDGIELLGSLGGSVVANDTMQVQLQATDAHDYMFAEIGGDVERGETASIGFWQGRRGRSLMKAGGDDLAKWLSTNFGNIFGDSLEGKSDKQLVKFYRRHFFYHKSKKSKGSGKLDARFMATAFNVYFTNRNLGGDLGEKYRFDVSDTGLGVRVINVRCNGRAFGVADGSDMTVMQVLLATNRLTDQADDETGFTTIYDRDGDGKIDKDEAKLRKMAKSVYRSIGK
ncbi:MAG: PKD domain-containing protein [Rubripirellula sp.]|nr:PKD domain-containing protein [Rubripirellula sp.]